MENLKNNKLMMLGMGSLLVGNGFRYMDIPLANHISCFVIGFSFSIIAVSIVKDYFIKRSI